jgi:hypothetical protein
MMTADAPPALSILDGIQLLAYHGGVIEMRMLKTSQGTVSGYFDDLPAAAAAVAPWDGVANIYVTANPVNSALLARAKNRLKPFAKTTTKDVDIVRRAWFLTDFDPERPAGISATDAELAQALRRRDEAVAFVRDLGFSSPVLTMSGNGGHADWIVDLPNTDDIRVLFEQALKALAAKFSDNAVKVDESVFNAARIWKVPGTIAVKGDATPERPHRRATPERLGPMTPLAREPLAALARLAPDPKRHYSPPTGGAFARLDLVAAFTGRGWYRRALRDGKHAMTCPWAAQHSGDSGLTETCLFEPQADTDPWGFDCKHAHCSTLTIRDVIAVLGLGTTTNGHHPPARPRPHRTSEACA